MANPKRPKIQVHLPHGGTKAAVDLLNALSGTEQKKLLSQLEKIDVLAAELLSKAMVTLEDLLKLTPSMMQEVLRELKDSDVVAVLKLASPQLQNHMMQNMSKMRAHTLKEEMGQRKILRQDAEKIVNQFMQTIRNKIGQGQIVLDQGKHDTLV